MLNFVPLNGSSSEKFFVFIFLLKSAKKVKSLYEAVTLHPIDCISARRFDFANNESF